MILFYLNLELLYFVVYLLYVKFKILNNMKVIITNSGKDVVSIVKEMTEEQYNFLLDVSNELNNEAEDYAPFAPIIYIRQVAN